MSSIGDAKLKKRIIFYSRELSTMKNVEIASRDWIALNNKLLNSQEIFT